MKETTTARSRWLRALLIGAVILVGLVGLVALEYFGATGQGYGFAVMYSVVFALVWGAMDMMLGRRRGRSR